MVDCAASCSDEVELYGGYGADDESGLGMRVRRANRSMCKARYFASSTEIGDEELRLPRAV